MLRGKTGEEDVAKKMRKSTRRSGQAVTVRDVALRAGVSPMTVSRVVRGEMNVRAATRNEVLAAVRELKYAPNLAARNLASADQTRIGLLFANPSAAYLTEFLVGMLDNLSRRGAQLIVERCEAGNALSEHTAMHNLIAGQVTGVLLPPPLSESRVVREEAANANIVAVAVATGHFAGDISCIRIDDHKAAYDMTRRILELGHRHIGFIKGHPNQTASAQRLAGFEAAIRDFAPRAKKVTTQGYFSYQSGLAAAERLLSGKTRPTAIFAANDDMAAAVVSVAHRKGLDVPHDISVVGFDDTAIATTLWPELTTVRQPIGEMAMKAVDLLFKEMRERKANASVKPVDVVMLHTLIERHSTAALNDQSLSQRD
jgi:LacI family transcriptional regulator